METSNTPAAAGQAEGNNQGRKYLGRWARAGATLVDSAIATPVATVTFLLTHGLLPVLGFTWFLEVSDSGELTVFATLIAASFIYHAVMIHRFGGTLGHLAVGGRIVHHATGERISPLRSTTRAALSSMDLIYIPLLVNAVMMLARKDRRHLYDHLAGTVAVQKER